MNSAIARLVLIASLCAGLFFANTRRDLRWTMDAYEWQPVRKRTLPQVVKSPGVMEAQNLSTLKSEVSESIVRKFIQEGQPVKIGQTLLELTRTTTQIEFDQKKNAEVNARYDMEKARKELTIQRHLFQKQAVPLKSVEDARDGYEKAKANYSIVKQELVLAQAKLDKTEVRAPISGVILKDFLIGRDRVASDQELFLIGDTSHFMVRAKVDELDIPKIKEGQEVLIKVDAYPDKVIKGRVRSIAAEAERQSFAKLDVLIDVVDDGHVPLKHNLSVQALIRVDEIREAIAVPLAAVKRLDDGNRAMALDKNHRLRSRTLKLGRLSENDVEVLSGIEEGDSVGVPAKKEASPWRISGSENISGH